MSKVSALARLEALESMKALPITQFRHRRLSDKPLVVIPLVMAGEAGSPLAVMIGQTKRSPRLIIVGQPRNPDQRFVFAAELGDVVMDYINDHRLNRREIHSRSGESRSRFTGAPQVLVPNRGGIKALVDLGRTCRFRKTTGDFPVSAVVPELGRWLTFLTDSAEQAGTSMLLALTDLLTEHWATGQSTLEDQNLASVMAWIAPPTGVSVEQALLDAENPVIWPPAGPSTSPEFDNQQLHSAIKGFDAARESGDTAAFNAAQQELRDLIGDQIKPTWRMMWDAIALLHGVPEAPSAAKRFDADCASFTDFSDYQETGAALPQRARDDAVGAARRLSRLERSIEAFEADMAFDDPFVLADRRSIGEAFAGTVEAVEPDRVVTSDKNRPILRPLIAIRTLDPTRLADGTQLISPTMPVGHKAKIVGTVLDEDSTLVTVEVVGGMGRPGKPTIGSIPELGQIVAYLPDPGWRATPTFPASGTMPWTHTDTTAADLDISTSATASTEEWGDED
ncbi:hypothetical protein ABZV58_28580 [Nocardia sp. NPDC004654]|uniref:hypothetical protein n=1 Tax=Nocardia sp. NPDC004654 TaxID=3154776 RepID=UPI0033B8DF9E